ncbi:hypothetical protein UFOVP384_5 [uncultured Caudovirales phage]|uniref:Uncharacterized protein n=1 Tax=uncultured Caudovirales phage TaxID=2100421 RepID=A0A6J7WZM6_9CAUD|nr:hypothetical protein UFOVP384_5 [uncultured Caudovirales phage]
MGATLTGQVVAETYEALLKVTDNGIITGTKKRITDGFGNDTPLLLSSTDVQIDGNLLLAGTISQYVRGDGSFATFTSGGLTSVGLTLGSAGTDAAVSGSPLTSNGSITLNLPSASATNRGLLTAANWTTFNSKLSSVGISMPSAFSVSGSPLTADGTITITGAGLASQYVRGDGTLANFPTTGGGGSSVSYYMNGSVSQGAILGNTYYEFNKTPIVGTGTDFTINANGYITQFITDANDPALLEIPGGNWNFEMYFSASSGGGTPSFYVELYKYNGTSFTLIASNSATPEGITGGTAIDLYTTALAVPQTVLTLTDRLAIRVYVTHSGRTITLHTENSHLCQVITTFSTGITALNSLTKQVQYLAIGTSGTDFAISSATDTHTFNLPTASGTNRGALSSADWTTFNGKVPSTRTLTINGTAFDLSADRSWTIAGSGISTLNTLTAGTQTFAVGTSGSDFNISSATSTHTFNIPDAGASARGVITTGTQTIAGAKTFSGNISTQGNITGSGGWAAATSSAYLTNNSATFGLLGVNTLFSKQYIYASGTSLSAGNNFVNLMLASSTTTEAISGVHTLVSQLAIKPIVLTNGAATTTNGATVYIEGAASGTATITNNYALWVDDGATRLDGGLLLTNQFNAQGGSSYNLVLSDWGKIIEMQNGGPNTVNIPTNATVPFPIGTEIQVIQNNSGQTTIAGAGVTLRSKSGHLKIANQFTGVTLVKRATDEWYVIGNLTA